MSWLFIFYVIYAFIQSITIVYAIRSKYFILLDRLFANGDWNFDPRPSSYGDLSTIIQPLLSDTCMVFTCYWHKYVVLYYVFVHHYIGNLFLRTMCSNLILLQSQWNHPHTKLYELHYI